MRLPIWAWVIVSRLLVLFAGVWGAAFSTATPGWQQFDPTGISSGMGQIGNLIWAASVRWDAVGYLTLAAHGYTSARSTMYFPLYPLLIRVLTPPGGSPVISGVMISLAAFAVGSHLVHRLARWQLGKRTADLTVLLIAFGPLSFVFSAVYSASLLFACAAGTFYLARQERFVFASIVAACAALSHIDGILLLGPLALMYWKSRGRPRDLRGLWSPSLPALALPAVTLAGFFTYLHTLGWGWLAPVANQNAVNASRTLVGPPIVLIRTVSDIVVELREQLHGSVPVGWGVLVPSAQNVVYLSILALAACALLSVWRRMPAEYALFGLLAILLCTSSAVAAEPLKGFDRYMLPVFPLWLGAATWIERRGLTTAVLTTSSALLVFYTIEFTRWVSVF